MDKKKVYCQNCGHNCHCGGYCFQDYGEKQETLCCTYCRHKEKEDSNSKEVNYNSGDYESFNGA